jgi:pimeloyl-ACP methyl ester carboxylesterase
VSNGVKWALIGLGVIVALLTVGVSYVLVQLTILQPPVVEANVIERRMARGYQETVKIAPISSYTKISAGQAAVYRAGTQGRVIVLLPDSGTGAWAFEPYLTVLSKSFRVYAVSLRGMMGAQPASNASFNDYVKDAQDALEVVRQNASLESNPPKVVLVGQGMGSLLALKLAQEKPQELEALTLIAPFVPREWSDQQAWLARNIGDSFYNNFWGDKTSAQSFWRDYFPSGFIQRDLARQYLEKYADARVPFEYRDVIREVTLGPLRWLQGAYDSLEKQTFPVLQVAARYDVVNPLVAQERLREALGQSLDARFSFAAFNSGRFVSMDWKWQNSAKLLEDFAQDLKLDAPVIEREIPLDPATENDPLKKP